LVGGTTVYHYLAGSWNPSYVKDVSSGVVTDLAFAGSFRVGKVQGGVNYYYHLDRLGSVRLVTQSANVQSFVGKYLPYGVSYATSGIELFQYAGKQLDVSTGLYYYGYRYLDSQSGRFTSADIQQPNYVNPQSLNRYPYALNNPNRYVDPDGRMFIDINDNGARIAGGIEAVTGKGFDHSAPHGPKEHSDFSIEMQRQISLQTGLPPSQITSTTTTVTTPPSPTTPPTTTAKKHINWPLMAALVVAIVAIAILAVCFASAGVIIAVPIAIIVDEALGMEIANQLANGS
jgi:RHS repeat-associated protein